MIFGRGKAELIGETACQYGKKVMLVTGTGSTKKSGLLDRVIEQIKTAGGEAVVFDKVTQNPLTTTAIEGAEIARSAGCDVVIGLGGGSIMDCAKAIAFLAVNDGDVNDYIFNRLVSDKALPIILVPTTCGTGSEGNGFAVLTNPENGDKKSLRCTAIIAKASIIDSTLMETMPKHILASVGFDALCHNIEAYISKIAQPMNEMMALYGMKLVGESLVEIYKGNNDPELWDKLTLASTLGGMVIHQAGVTICHGMEHPASGLRNIVHGRGLAALILAIMEKTVDAIPEKATAISQAIGGSSAGDCVEYIDKMLTELDLKVTLGEQGIERADIPWMTENFFRVSAPGHANHPVNFTAEEISELFELSM